MNRSDIAKLMMAISAAYPYYAKQQAELDRYGRDATMNVWEMALDSVEYADASRALAMHIKQSKFAPAPAEIIELAQKCKPGIMDLMAYQSAAYRLQFKDWMNDGLSHSQRVRRMEQEKLEAWDKTRWNNDLQLHGAGDTSEPEQVRGPREHMAIPGR